MGLGPAVEAHQVYLQVGDGEFIWPACRFEASFPQHLTYPTRQTSLPSEPSMMIKGHEWQPSFMYQTPPMPCLLQRSEFLPWFCPGVKYKELKTCPHVRDK